MTTTDEICQICQRRPVNNSVNVNGSTIGVLRLCDACMDDLFDSRMSQSDLRIEEQRKKFTTY